MVTQPEIAANDMFQEPYCLHFHEDIDHDTEDLCDGKESVVCSADVL